MAAQADEDKIMYMVAYVLPVLTGLFVYFMYAQKNKRLKFHGVQSIIYWIAALVLYYVLVVIFVFVPFLGWLPALVWLLLWLAALYVGYEAMLDSDMYIPIVTNIAKNAV